MGYFGGLGAGKGWLKLLFLVEPEALEQVLAATAAVLVVSNRRVLVDYKATPLAEFMAAYRRYLDALLESPKSAGEATSELRIGLASALHQFSFQPCPDTRFKLVESEEPILNLAPAQLYYDARRGQLCTNVGSTDVYFGLELSYPRVFSTSGDRHEVLYETRGSENHRLFEDLKSRIQKVTAVCKIRSPARVHRTPLRISEAMRERMKQHPGLKASKLEIV